MPPHIRIAVEAFSNAVLDIPRTLLQNGGGDSEGTLSRLITAHSNPGGQDFGVDVASSTVIDMREAGVWELALGKRSARAAPGNDDPLKRALSGVVQGWRENKKPRRDF